MAEIETFELETETRPKHWQIISRRNRDATLPRLESSRDRDVRDRERSPAYIGPLLTLYGRQLGVNSRQYEGPMAFALDIGAYVASRVSE